DMIGETGFLSILSARLAEALYGQDRLDEAQKFTVVSEQAAASADLASQIGWRRIRALVLAGRGHPRPAEALAFRAAAPARGGACVDTLATALLALAEVLTLTGKPADAVPAVEEALALYEAKGNLVMADRARTTLAETKAHSR